MRYSVGAGPHLLMFGGEGEESKVTVYVSRETGGASQSLNSMTATHDDTTIYINIYIFIKKRKNVFFRKCVAFSTGLNINKTKD